MEMAGWPGWTSDRIRELAARVVPGGWILGVDESTEAIVASALGLRAGTESGVPVGELSWVAADPTYSGQGLGRAVSARATDRLLESGCCRVHLRTEDFRLAALKTYLTLGYEPHIPEAEVAGRWHEIDRRIGRDRGRDASGN
jgi:mycothiol synthase